MMCKMISLKKFLAQHNTETATSVSLFIDSIIAKRMKSAIYWLFSGLSEAS